MTRKIIITGGASGIGREAAKLFVANGWHVGIADRNFAAAKALADELDVAATPLDVDVLDPLSVSAAIDSYCGEAGLDALFSSAGLLDMRTFGEAPLDRLHQIIDVNVKGLLTGIHASLPYLRKKANSQIVNMGSLAGVYGIPGEAAYSASKFAVRGITEALNIELETQGIWVSDIMVGYVETPMITNAKHVAKSVAINGVNVKPADVAAFVWNAIHERRVHWFIVPQEEQLFEHVNSVAPVERRSLIKSITGF